MTTSNGLSDESYSNCICFFPKRKWVENKQAIARPNIYIRTHHSSLFVSFTDDRVVIWCLHLNADVQRHNFRLDDHAYSTRDWSVLLALAQLLVPAPHIKVIILTVCQIYQSSHFDNGHVRKVMFMAFFKKKNQVCVSHFIAKYTDLSLPRIVLSITSSKRRVRSSFIVQPVTLTVLITSQNVSWQS